MIVTTIKKECINTISLPTKIKGQYWLHESVNNNLTKLISIEGIEDKWYLKSNRHVKVIEYRGEEEISIKSKELEPLTINILQKEDGERLFVYVEPITEDRQIFTKYVVDDDVDLSIGRDDKQDISIASKVVSTRHAILSHRNGQWSIKDNDSTNGIFVNDLRVREASLQVGDVIFIMGLKIIIGQDLVAINNPDGEVKVSDKLKVFEPQRVAQLNEEDDEYEIENKEYFYRSPRFKRDIEQATFRIDSPPASPLQEEMPWMLVMGSSMAMGMMSVINLVSAIATFNIMSIVTGASMLVGTLLLPTMTKKYEKKRTQQKEALRQRKYRDYLDKMAKQINEACRQQENILKENNVTIDECVARIQNTQRNLWERSMGQNDFLKVRVGVGNGTLDAKIQYSERKFTLQEDDLQEELYALCESDKSLQNIPITYSLQDNYVSGIIGLRNEVVEFAKGLIIQLAALYSYDEVKFVFIYDEKEEKDFEFVKWLPHVWSDDKKFRFIATNNSEVKEVSSYLESVVETRKNLHDKKEKDNAKPYYIIFSMSKMLAIRADMIKEILNKDENMHMSIISFYDEIKELPKECTMVVELDGNNSKLFDKNDMNGNSINFVPDINLKVNPLDLSKKLANTLLDMREGSSNLPALITFLEMFDVGKVEHLNALTKWKENDPTVSLGAEVGVNAYGETFKLDLHQKFHGPHGLIAGMTGSGKSEFIMTYILSLAVNYHPNEVSFLLIDYKGGGMAKAFETLPHTAGIITNLDGASINRSLVSIQSELRRRQDIFNEAAQKVGTSNLDIYDYQKLYRENKVSEPLPHLFIISDEFAELKTQQPDFMDKLISAARIGRSLGVHLILATQKPSGVVSDQIWSNTKFRVCLKVQDREDSQEMLKRPDAAELRETGRFYLQVGYNEMFELGQSAWAGASYYPSERVAKEKDNSIVVVDKNGHIIKQVKMDKKTRMMGKADKQLDAVVRYLKDTAKEEGIKIRPLWLEPIPDIILIDDIKKKYKVTSEKFILNPVIGEYDVPALQKQNVLRLPLSSDGNVVVYGSAGAGKTSFINALVYSLIHEHSPEEVNIYLLDFASETLKAFKKAPHIGDVMTVDNREKISNLFKMLKQEVKKRKNLFANYGGDYASYIRSSKNTLPNIVVAINNYAVFAENFDNYEEDLLYLTREGIKYGIYFVLTALTINSVRYNLVSNFKTLITLQLNDATDYQSILGRTDGLVPSNFKGRGLVKLEDIYEFQVASIADNSSYETIVKDCEEQASLWEGQKACEIPVLPKIVNIDFIKDYVNNGKLDIPIGVEKTSLKVNYYPFGSNYINFVTAIDNQYQDFIVDFSRLIGTICKWKGIIFDTTGKFTNAAGTLKLCSNSKDCRKHIEELYNIALERNKKYKQAEAKKENLAKFEPIIVIINDFKKLKEYFPEPDNENLLIGLLGGTTKLGITIILGEQIGKVFSYDKWFTENDISNNYIWVGNNITSQNDVKYSLSPNRQDNLPYGFGYVTVKGKTEIVKLLNEREEIEEDEQ